MECLSQHPPTLSLAYKQLGVDLMLRGSAHNGGPRPAWVLGKSEALEKEGYFSHDRMTG